MVFTFNSGNFVFDSSTFWYVASDNKSHSHSRNSSIWIQSCTTTPSHYTTLSCHHAVYELSVSLWGIRLVCSVYMLPARFPRLPQSLTPRHTCHFVTNIIMKISQMIKLLLVYAPPTVQGIRPPQPLCVCVCVCVTCTIPETSTESDSVIHKTLIFFLTLTYPSFYYQCHHVWWWKCSDDEIAAAHPLPLCKASDHHSL